MIHSSIHPFICVQLVLFRIAEVMEPRATVNGRRQSTPSTGHRSSWGKRRQKNTHIHTHTVGKFRKLKCMFLNCERKPE